MRMIVTTMQAVEEIIFKNIINDFVQISYCVLVWVFLWVNKCPCHSEI